MKTVKLGLLPEPSSACTEYLYKSIQREASYPKSILVSTRQTWFRVEDLMNLVLREAPEEIRKELSSIRSRAKGHKLVCFGWDFLDI